MVTASTGGHADYVNYTEQLPPPAATKLAPAVGSAQSMPHLDPESRAWIDSLGGNGSEREPAIEVLHGLLLKAARFEVNRRSTKRSPLRWGNRDDLAQQSADDALVAVLSKLDDFRGESRFTTWAYKFALLEVGSKLRRRAWQRREIPLEPESWLLIADRHSTPPRDLETAELLAVLREAIQHDLSHRQRQVLVATTLNDVPIDVLAERLGTTRGALYKTIHDARHKLRAALTARGLGVGEYLEATSR